MNLTKIEAFHHYRDMLGITDAHYLKEESEKYRCDVYEKNPEQYLDVYHPAEIVRCQERWVNQIVGVVERWAGRESGI